MQCSYYTTLKFKGFCLDQTNADQATGDRARQALPAEHLRNGVIYSIVKVLLPRTKRRGAALSLRKNKSKQIIFYLATPQTACGALRGTIRNNSGDVHIWLLLRGLLFKVHFTKDLLEGLGDGSARWW